MKCSDLVAQTLVWSHFFYSKYLRILSRLSTITILFVCFLPNCSWTPQVETVLHDTTEGYVSLRTLTDETVRVSHPAEISDAVLTRIFQGLQKQQNVRLLQTFVTGTPEPTTIFSPSQITFLTPLVKEALAQATKEEEVYFRLTNIDGSNPSVEGSLFIYSSNLMFTLHPKVPLGSGKNRPSTKSSKSGLGKSNFSLTFHPKEALSTDEFPQVPRLKPFNSHAVLINISKLEKMSANLGTPHQEATTSKPTLSQDSMTTSPPPSPPFTPTKSQTPKFIKPDASSTHHNTEDSNLIQQLQKQMDALKKQLGEQKAEIERLKKQQR